VKTAAWGGGGGGSVMEVRTRSLLSY
jgi:hypothetical protein